MKKFKQWLRCPMVFEDKRDFLVVLFLIFILGAGFGQWWRIAQVEPLLEREILILEKEQKYLQKQLGELEGKLGAFNKKFKKQGHYGQYDVWMQQQQKH